MYEQNRSISKETEILKRNPKETLALKSTINAVKSLLKEFKARFEQVKEGISEFEDGTLEIIKSEKQNKKDCKKVNKSSGSCRTLGKQTNIRIVGVPEGEEREKEEREA